MAGRRLRGAISSLAPNITVVIAGLSNAYTSYVTTPEEYTMQRYEGASTLYGINQLPAMITEFNDLTQAILKGTAVPPGPSPIHYQEKMLSHINLQTGVVLDTHPLGTHFGAVHTDVNITREYKFGDSVSVTFWTGHPKNDLKLGKTYTTVERKVGDDWIVVLTDNDWDTKYMWKRVGIAHSLATIEWSIGETVSYQPGIYRIRHFGAKKNLLGKISHFIGSSSEFQLF
jgi:neutral ceramidase